MRYGRYSILILLIAIAGCDGNSVQETLGLNRKAPDEYRVVTRPPLSVPPQFTLRPPAAPGEVVDSQATDKKAQALILGAPLDSGNTFALPSATDTSITPVQARSASTLKSSSPESSLLQRAGADEANPNIRQVIEEDKLATYQPIEEEDSWWDVLSVLPPKKDPLVDAKKEAERIKQNEEEGKPITEGETPEVKQRDTGILGRILGY